MDSLLSQSMYLPMMVAALLKRSGSDFGAPEQRGTIQVLMDVFGKLYEIQTIAGIVC